MLNFEKYFHKTSHCAKTAGVKSAVHKWSCQNGHAKLSIFEKNHITFFTVSEGEPSYMGKDFQTGNPNYILYFVM